MNIREWKKLRKENPELAFLLMDSFMLSSGEYCDSCVFRDQEECGNCVDNLEELGAEPTMYCSESDYYYYNSFEFGDLPNYVPNSNG